MLHCTNGNASTCVPKFQDFHLHFCELWRFPLSKNLPQGGLPPSATAPEILQVLVLTCAGTIVHCFVELRCFSKIFPPKVATFAPRILVHENSAVFFEFPTSQGGDSSPLPRHRCRIPDGICDFSVSFTRFF